ncbi:MAG: hypothetical protein ORN28_08095, partial [Rhodoferax sp.]|nr:hypothetical protein [Rhodoferax sp.]
LDPQSCSDRLQEIAGQARNVRINAALAEALNTKVPIAPEAAKRNQGTMMQVHTIAPDIVDALAARYINLEDAAVYLDLKDPALIYAMDLDEQLVRIAVHINYTGKGQLDGQRVKFTSNFVISGGVVQARNLAQDTQYL